LVVHIIVLVTVGHANVKFWVRSIEVGVLRVQWSAHLGPSNMSFLIKLSQTISK